MDQSRLSEVPTPVLSKRELQVLILASGGFGERDTGVALRISEETVKSHRKHILRKLDARNIAHAVAIGFRLGLFRDELREAA